LFAAGLDSLENMQNKKYKEPSVVSVEFRRPYHAPFRADAYYDGSPNARAVALYELPVKDKSKPNVLKASSLDNGVFDISVMPEMIDGKINKCALCHGTEHHYRIDL
jgi:hypothetical protein